MPRDITNNQNYSSNMNKRNNNLSQEQKLRRATDTSVRGKGQKTKEEANYRKGRHKISGKKLGGLVTTFLAGAIAATLAYGPIQKQYQNTQDITTTNNYILNETEALDIINRNTTTIDKDTYWRDAKKMGLEVLDQGSEVFHETLYGIYNRIAVTDKEEAISTVDEVVTYMGRVIESMPDEYPGFTPYKSFNDYLQKTGCVDKNGNPSVDKYQEKMVDYIIAKKNMQEASIGITDSAKISK